MNTFAKSDSFVSNSSISNSSIVEGENFEDYVEESLSEDFNLDNYPKFNGEMLFNQDFRITYDSISE